MPADSWTVNASSMLPDVLTAYPQLRSVFDRYGLRGCGGPLGPAESIEYFARAHGVPLEQLLRELRDELAAPSQPVAASVDDTDAPVVLGDSIYRRFFKAGILVVLTVGAVWGAAMLVRIALAGSFAAVSIHEINAHGHAQIFGWVGLFVMGFAYQAFPRIKHTNLWRPDLANMSFFLMVAGIFVRAIGEPLFGVPMFRELAFAAGMAEIVAVSLFITVIVQTLRTSDQPFAVYDTYIIVSLLFFLVQAVYGLAHYYATTAARTPEALIHVVSTYQGPLRDLQVHGFAMLMILGVGLRMFPPLFGLREASQRLARAGAVLLPLAVVGEVVMFIVMRLSGAAWAGGPLYLFVLLLVGLSIALTWRWGIASRAAEDDRSAKFIRAGVIWLHVSMLMLALLPVYVFGLLPTAGVLSASGHRAVEIGFSHAYGGAVRHAITVGFISLMILGMAAKVVPTLNGVDVRRLRALWIPFILVNVGCAMRVSFQIATDFAEWAYPIAGISGLLEVTGIAIWGVQLWRVMNGWSPAETRPVLRPARIEGDHRVSSVIDWFPQTLPVFLANGFAPLANPVARRTLGRAISVRQAAAKQGVPLDRLLQELNAAALVGRNAMHGEARLHIPLPVFG